MKKQREQTGVELYSFQQGLAKLQLSLEKSHQAVEDASNSRHENEGIVKVLNEDYKKAIKEEKAVESKRIAAQRRLDQSQVTLQQIAEFNSKVKGEILATRRAAYGTEAAMQALERKKRRQDELVDQINEQLKASREQLQLYEAQIEAQKQETSQAHATLREAQTEMEKIRFEKKDYLQRWKSSLVGMANRDTAMQAAQQALGEQREELRGLEVSIKGVKKAIRKEQDRNDLEQGTVDRHLHEVAYLDRSLMQIEETKQELGNQFKVFRTTLDATDTKLERALTEQKQLNSEIEQVHKNYENLMQEKQKLDHQISENVSNRTTIEKGAQNVWKTTLKLEKDIHQKQIQMGEIENEIARIKVDALNTDAHNKELKSTLDAYDKELQDKDHLIEKYELEIRQRHDKIEKKQIYIARLNRKYEKLTSNNLGEEDTNTGPLEATIKNLRKEMTVIDNSSGDLQREWIKNQQELVQLATATSKEMETVQKLRAKETILTQKKLRFTADEKKETFEVKELKSQITSLHADLVRLNQLIAKNKLLQEKVANDNYNIENDFMQKLRDMEIQSVKKDAEIQNTKQVKEDILNQLVELEKQIMLWEKKIQIERETQEALDPEYGQPEIKGMEKEIHRMSHRLNKLLIHQEKMVKEMERVIYKREAIKLQGHTASKRVGHITQAQLRKKISVMRNALQRDVGESKKIGSEIDSQEVQNDRLIKELEAQQSVYNDYTMRRHQLIERVDDGYFRRQLGLEKKLELEQLTRMYKDALNNTKPSNQEVDVATRLELKAELDKTQKLDHVVSALIQQNPKHDAYLKRLKNSIN